MLLEVQKRRPPRPLRPLRSSGACPPPIHNHKERQLLPPCARLPAASPQPQAEALLPLRVHPPPPRALGHCAPGDLCVKHQDQPEATELERLIQGITVKCQACEQYLPFSTFASPKLDNLCDEEGTRRSTACNSGIHGENKQKAPCEVGKMDKIIVHIDEVGNDDDSSGDNHGMSEDVFSFEDDSVEEGEEIEKPMTLKRVAGKCHMGRNQRVKLDARVECSNKKK